MKLLIYGSREFARTVARLAELCGHEPVGFVDDHAAPGQALGGFEAVRHSHPPGAHGMVLGIGYGNLPGRWAAWQRVREAGYACPSLVHPRAYVADTAVLGDGCLVMAQAVVDERAQLGDAVVLWPMACVNHDGRIGANTFLSPQSTLCGHVHVGAHSFVGAGAVLVDRVQLPESSFTKAAALVKAPRPDA